MAALTIDRVGKSFGGLPVLSAIELDVADGEFVALVGPSGCGKSTLLRILAGLDDATRGAITLGGRVINHLSPRERNVAMVFQGYALYPHMSVRDNLGFNLRLAGRPKAEIAERVGRAAALLELTPLLDRRPAQLSGGQRQRVAMGRAIVRKPDLFLFDEPLSNLDAQLRVQMRVEIKALHQAVPTTSIYVTHDQIEAMTLADRIVVMRGGRVEQVGTPAELYARPANLFVARFIGSPSMNLLPAQADEAGQTRLAGGGPALALALGLMAGARGVVGVRPEHVRLGEGERATVRMVEPTGAQAHVHLDLSGQRLLAVVEGDRPPRAGEEVGVSWDPARVHVFDNEGRRVGRR